MAGRSQLEYPQRRRCLACRGSLGAGVGDAVLFGLYCSPICAGIPNPATRADQAPRECRTERDGRTVFKRRYRCEAEIPVRLREDPSSAWYRCQACGHLHIGHSRVDFTAGMTRTLTTRAQVAELLVKSRGQASIKQVAEVLKVPQVRVRECEDPAFPNPRLDVVFALLALYRLKLAVQFSGTRHSAA